MITHIWIDVIGITRYQLSYLNSHLEMFWNGEQAARV